MPPADYVMRQRVERAKELLAATDIAVAEIALALGFSTPQYFATVFCRYTGQTPSSFRNAASTLMMR